MIAAVTILHVAAAAAWFGHKLLVPRDVRISVREAESATLLLGRMRRAQALGIVSGVVTLGTGLWLMSLTTGFTDAAIETYVALGVVITIFLVSALVARPAWNRVSTAIEAGRTPDAVAGAGDFGRALQLESLLWVVALTAMLI